MKKSLLTIAAAFCYSFAVFAQAPPQRTCGTMQHHAYLQQTRPNYTNDLNQYNQMIDQYLIDHANQQGTNRTSAAATSPTVIPVVVHVVYNTAVPATSISISQAASQVQVLNDDFAKLNADASKVTQPTFSTVASGANIRFCLAQRDPNGNATTGVDYRATTTSSFATNDAVKAASTGGADPWDVTKYINIWICDLGSTILGYGEFPTASLSNTYGLVLHYKYTGSGGSAIAPYNLGRTGTHEFGHCFNLLHIWGDDGSACTGSDQCADTPNQASEHYGPFAQGSIQTDACTTTSPGTMWMNYMDYTDDNSMYAFTANQVSRMEAVVSTAPWNVLQGSLGCTPVSALDAGISAISSPLNGSSTCNNSVTPVVTLNNAGSTTITTAKILYKMDALATQTLSWSGSLAAGASTVLTLNAYTGLTSASHTFSVSVTAPNSGTDANSANNTLLSTFTVAAGAVGATLPFTEKFESGVFPPAGWLKTSANVGDATATWSGVANSTGIPVVPTTTACAKMDNFAGTTSIVGQLDALRTPALNFTGANSTLRLVFDRSHQVYSTTDIDSLNIYISTDCGGSWTKLYTKGGAQLATVTGSITTAYTPTANAQWARDSVSLSAYSGLSGVWLKFESRSGWGNNLYLDNINVKYSSAAAPVANFSAASTKCVGNSIAFTDASSNAPTSWSWSFPGATTTSSTAQNPTVTYTAAGIYTVTHSSSNATGTSTPVSSTISVSANPTVAVTSATICNGATANINASGASTYNWSTGATTASISVSPATTTSYTVTGLNAAGCSNTKTASVMVNPLPSVTMGAVTSPICVSNAPVTLTGSPTGATGMFSGTGVSGSSFNPTTAGAGTFTLTYSYTDVNGCSAAATRIVTVSLCTGITELSNTNISVFPNPAKDAINVSMDIALVNNTTIELYDAIGKLVLAEKAVSTNTSIVVSSLAKGIYTIRIVSEGKQLSKRIIKE